MVSDVLPRTDFIATTVTSGVKTLLPCRDLWKGNALKDSVLNKTPMKKVKWATLFAYMHRRFGPPHIGGDDYKDLSAGWILTSPDPDVVVKVSPSLSGVGFSFSPYLQFDALDDRVLAACDLGLSAERVEAIKNAYRDTLIDLLRPVCVRDHSINALGEIGDTPLDEGLLAYDEEKDESVYEVRFHPSSGYPIPPGLFGGEDWAVMCTLIQKMGNGDMTAGRTVLISLLQDRVIADISKEPWAVRRLVLRGVWRDRVSLGQRIGLDAVAMERLEAENVHERAIVEEMTDEAVKTAVGYINCLGYGGFHLADQVKQYRFDVVCDEAWKDLVAIAKEDFPADAIPADHWMLGKTLPDAIKAEFVKLGRQDLASWVDRTVGKQDGLGVLMRICGHLIEQLKQQEPA